jgi:hypothetical protein
MNLDERERMKLDKIRNERSALRAAVDSWNAFHADPLRITRKPLYAVEDSIFLGTDHPDRCSALGLYSVNLRINGVLSVPTVSQLMLVHDFLVNAHHDAKMQEIRRQHLLDHLTVLSDDGTG